MDSSSGIPSGESLVPSVGSLGIPSGGSTGDDNQSSSRIERSYCRHTTEQTARLEEIFSENPHPDDVERRSIAKELGLELKQVKFWFQNKRTQKKAQKERADNNALRAENERIESENIVMRETLKNILCPSCGGPPSDTSKDRGHSWEQLKLENERLKDEFKKVSKLLESYKSNDPNGPNTTLNLGLPSASHSTPGENIMPNPMSKREENEKALMFRAVTAAKEELVRLFRTNEPLWVKSQADPRRFILHPQSYEQLFPRVNHFQSSKGREESSKDSRIVRINPLLLIDMFMDSRRWTNLFSTIISRAQTIKVVEKGSLEHRSGALLLMYEEMHVLSPLVPPREFYFLRYCEKVHNHVWMITDVSFDYLQENTPPRSWKLPSGCMIIAMPYGCSQVVWVEHVEVEEKIQTHRLYKDVVGNGIAFGAERWLNELQRICERFSSPTAHHIPSYYAARGVIITTPEERRNLIKLSHRMIKTFCEVLNMSDKANSPPNSQEANNSGVRISVHKNTEPGTPIGMIFVAVASFWLPIPPQNLFHFFIDLKRRPKWDALCLGKPVVEIAHIPTGTHPGNSLSVIRPVNPIDVLVMQESFVDPLGAHVIYSPVNVPDLDMALSGQDSSKIFLLPSGVTISEDGRSAENARAASSSRNGGRTRGSLVTLAIQIVMSTPTAVNLDAVGAVHSLITTAVKNIKDALNFCDLE